MNSRDGSRDISYGPGAFERVICINMEFETKGGRGRQIATTGYA